MAADILTLRTMSTLFLAYAKGVTSSSAEQEVQGMFVGGSFVFASNLAVGTDSIATALRGGKSKDKTVTIGELRASIKALLNPRTQLKLDNGLPEAEETAKAQIPALLRGTGEEVEGSRVDSVDDLLALKEGQQAYMYATNPQNGADNFGKAALHLLKGGGIGAAESGTFLHAEQSMLRMLALRLGEGSAPAGEIIVAGAKDPCRTCLKVLRAFSSAYEIVYDKKLTFVNRMGDGGGTLMSLSVDDIEAGTSAMWAFKRVLQKELTYFGSL